MAGSPQTSTRIRRLRRVALVLWALSISLLVSAGSTFAAADKVTVCNPSDKGSTIEVSQSAFENGNFTLPPCGGSSGGEGDDTDYCLGELNPGTQSQGTQCIVADTTDYCPGELNPGAQSQGTQCVVADTTDHCPGELNPGVQASGTTCIVAGSGNNGSSSNNGTPGSSDGGANAGGGTPDEAFVDPAVEVDRGTSPLAVGAQGPDFAGVGAEVAGAQAAAGGTTAAGGGVNVPAGTALPYTGFETNLALAMALVAFLLGGIAYRHAGRVQRARVAA